MIDHKLVNLLEAIGYVNNRGKRVYGTAALLHFLHTPVSILNKKYVEV